MNDLDTPAAFVRALLVMVMLLASFYVMALVLAGMAQEVVPGA